MPAGINFGAGTLYVSALPTHNPGNDGARRAINTATGEKYRWVSGTTWEVEPGGGGLENPVDHIDFVASPATSIQPRRLQWNADAGTLDLGMDAAGVVQQIGEELFFRVKNQTGSAIADGTLVMAAGTTGNSGRILVAPSINDGSVPGHMLVGIVTHSLANGADGFATHFGQVRGINTTGAGVGETWADGDLLYPNPAQVGKLTNVLPTGAGLKNPIAIVIHAHSNGSIFVRMSPDNKTTLIYEYDGWEYSEEDLEFICVPPTITPGIYGPFFAKSTNENCGQFWQWDIQAQQWRPYYIYYGQQPTGTANRLASYNSGGSLTSLSWARVVGSILTFDNRVYFGVSDAVRTSNRSPYNSQGPFFARHVNGGQYTDLRLAYGAFDLFREDRNPGGSLITTAITFRNTNTPGDYRSPVPGDEMYVQRARITRRYVAPYDPYSDASSVDFITMYVQSVNAITKDVGVKLQLRTRKNTDPIWTDGGGNIAFELDENLNAALPGYPNTRNDSGLPENMLSTDAAGALKSHSVQDLFSSIPQISDASATNNCIYYSTTQSKLCYKDPGGTVNPLY